MDEKKLLKKNLLMFPLGTVGRDMVYNLFASQLLTFVLFTRYLTDAQLAAITTIMIAARVFDAFNDPIMGFIIENTHTRWGKFKPWLVIGILLTSVVTFAMFNSGLGGWGFVWFFGAMYFMYSIAYTMHDISYWGMIPALSSDPDARNQFTSRATLFAGIGGTLASILIPMLTAGSMALGGNTITAYGIIAAIISVIAPLFLCFTIFGAHEHIETGKSAEKQSLSLKAIFKTLTSNDQLMWVSLVFLIQQVGQNIVLGGVGSTYIYFEFGYNGGLYSLFTTVGMSATAFLMIFYPAISRRIHRKPLMKIMMLISVVGYALMLIPGIVLPTGNVKFVFIVLGYMLSNFGQYCFYLIMMISIINTVEYSEYISGSRDEAMIASLRPFITKLGSALVVLVTSLSYMIFRVTDYTNQISSYETAYNQGYLYESEKLDLISEALKGVTSGQNIGLLVMMTLVPCVMMLAAHLIYMKKYKLDEDEYDRICKELEARRG